MKKEHYQVAFIYIVFLYLDTDVPRFCIYICNFIMFIHFINNMKTPFIVSLI